MTKQYLSENKNLMQLWDWDANKELDPANISIHSHKRVWWKCEKCGYKYSDSVKQLNKRKHICPKCNNRILIQGVNDLATTHPEITKEWHPTKNGNLTPKDVKANSTKKVWWICKERHHEWQTQIRWRTQLKYNCPKCSSANQTSFPEQAIFFYIKNIFSDAINRYKASFLGNMELDIYIPSIRVAIEYDGEAWHKKGKEDIERRKYKICKEHDIYLIRFKEGNKREYSDLADNCYFIPTDKKHNNILDKSIIFMLNSIDLSYERLFGNNLLFKNYDVDTNRDALKIRKLFQTKIKDSLVELYPEIADEWMYNKNEGLTPDRFSVGSKVKVWWKCKKCGYEWISTINHRTSSKSGCPCCASKVIVVGINDLATTHPEIAKEWHPTKNLPDTLENITYGCGKKYWWKCSKCGYEWITSPNRRTSLNAGCHKCANRLLIEGINDLATTHPEIAKEWHPTKNGNLLPRDVKAGSNKKIWWKCLICGKEWVTTVKSRTYNGICCCYKCRKSYNSK